MKFLRHLNLKLNFFAHDTLYIMGQYTVVSVEIAQKKHYLHLGTSLSNYILILYILIVAIFYDK